jgi:hypothetical protein
MLALLMGNMNATKLTLLAPLALALFVGCASDVEDEDTSILRDPVSGEYVDGEGQPDELDECAFGETQSCEDDNGVTGLQTCEPGDEGYVWSECAVASASSSTPLVLSFDGAPVQMNAAAGGFDLAGMNASIGTDWPAARTPWLALDRNGNGRIDDGSELFGSMTVLASGERAHNGFEALAELDSDGDGSITANDARFAELVLWADGDQNRVSSIRELQPLSAAGVSRIALDYDAERRCDARGNCEVERSDFELANGSAGTVVDIHLAHR